MNFGTFYNILAETNLKKFGYKMTLHVFYLLFVFLMIVVVILYSRTTLSAFWCLTLIYLEKLNDFNNAPPRNLTIVISFHLKYWNNLQQYFWLLSKYIFSKTKWFFKVFASWFRNADLHYPSEMVFMKHKKKNSHEKEVHTYFYWRKKNKLFCPHCSFHWICCRLKTNYQIIDN